MSSLNRAELIGNLCNDPEIRDAGGSRVANFRMATSEKYKSKSGEQKEATEYHSVAVWGDKLVGIVQQYLAKGSKIYIAGQIKTRKWQDKDGNDRYSTEIVLSGFDSKLIMLDKAGRSEGVAEMKASRSDTTADLDDEIPF